MLHRWLPLLLRLCLAINIISFNSGGIAFVEIKISEDQLTRFPASNSLIAPAYQLGSHSRVITMWHPFETDAFIVNIFLNKAYELMKETADDNGEFTFSFMLKQTTWEKVASDPYCVKSSKIECPDITVLGTTQIAGRVANGDFVSLNQLFRDYVYETGEVLAEKILQKYLYDYNFGGQWYGIPMLSDIRVFYYNQTTLNALGLKHPPPVGDWGKDYKKTWNWAEMVSYAKIIKNAGYREGFYFVGGWDEELKLITAIMRDYKLFLVNDDRSCSLDNANFRLLLDEVLRPLFTTDYHAANLDVNLIDSAAMQTWIKSGPDDPLKQQWPCCKSGTERVLGFYWSDINFPKAMMYDPVIQPTGDIRVAYVPGKATFLGGSGLLLTAKSNETLLSWKYIRKFSETSTSVKLNDYLNALPPYYSVLDDEPKYQSSEFAILRKQFDNAVPIQYPNPSFPELTELEARKPLRMLLMELIYKGYPNDVLINRTCKLIDDIMLPNCDVKHMITNITECDPTLGKRNLIYSWPVDKKCKAGISLLEPVSFSCSFVPPWSGISLGINIVAALTILIGFLILCLFFYFRFEMAIRKASITLSSLVIIGAILSASSVFLMSGNPRTKVCGADAIILGYGVALAIGALFMKMWRLVMLFQIKTTPPDLLTDTFMVNRVGIILVVQTGLICFWWFVQSPAVVVVQTVVPGTTIKFNEYVCGSLGSPIAGGPIFVNVIFLFGVVYYAFIGRRIPAEYNDGQYIGIIIYTITFLVCIIFPANAYLTDPFGQYAITAGGIVFGSLSTCLVYGGPKIMNAYHKVRLREEEVEKSEMKADKFQKYRGTNIHKSEIGSPTK